MLKRCSVKGIIYWERTKCVHYQLVMCLCSYMLFFPVLRLGVGVDHGNHSLFRNVLASCSAYSEVSLPKAEAERTANISAIRGLKLLMQRSFQSFLSLPGN